MSEERCAELKCLFSRVSPNDVVSLSRCQKTSRSMDQTVRSKDLSKHVRQIAAAMSVMGGRCPGQSKGAI